MENRAGVRDDMIGEIFEDRAFTKRDASVLESRRAKASIDLGGRRSGQADVSDRPQRDLGLQAISSQYPSCGIQQHEAECAAVNRDWLKRLQWKREAALREHGCCAAPLEGEREPPVFPDAIRRRREGWIESSR